MGQNKHTLRHGTFANWRGLLNICDLETLNFSERNLFFRFTASRRNPTERDTKQEQYDKAKLCEMFSYVEVIGTGIVQTSTTLSNTSL